MRTQLRPGQAFLSFLIGYRVTVGAPKQDGISGRVLLQGSADNDFSKDGIGGKVAGLAQYKAGKTTLIRLLLGFLRPTSGAATIDGLDCQTQSVAVRERVAYLPAEAKLFDHMRGGKHPIGRDERAC